MLLAILRIANIIEREAQPAVGNVRDAVVLATDHQTDGNVSRPVIGVGIMGVLDELIQNSITILAADELAELLQASAYLLAAAHRNSGGIQFLIKNEIKRGGRSVARRWGCGRHVVH